MFFELYKGKVLIKRSYLILKTKISQKHLMKSHLLNSTKKLIYQRINSTVLPYQFAIMEANTESPSNPESKKIIILTLSGNLKRQSRNQYSGINWQDLYYKLQLQEIQEVLQQRL